MGRLKIKLLGATALVVLSFAAKAQTFDVGQLFAGNNYLRQIISQLYNAKGSPCAAPPTAIPSSGGNVWYFDAVNGNDTPGACDGTVPFSQASGTHCPWAQVNSLFANGGQSAPTGVWGNARLATVHAGSPVHSGDLVWVMGNEDYYAINEPGGNGLTQTDWVTIAAMPGTGMPRVPQLVMGAGGGAKYIFYGFLVSEYNTSGTLQTLGNGSRLAATYVAGQSNIMLLGNVTQTAYDSTVYSSWTQSQWGSLMVNSTELDSGNNCVIDTSYSKNGGQGGNVDYTINNSNWIVLGGTIDGYAGDGVHTAAVNHLFVEGMGILNNNNQNGNHNDFIQIGVLTTQTSSDIHIDHSIAIRNTGVGRVIWTNGGGELGTQGFDNFGQTYGTAGFYITNSFIEGSGGAGDVQMLTFLGSYNNNVFFPSYPANTGTPSCVFCYADKNVIMDDNFYSGSTPSELSTSGAFPQGNPVTITNISATNFSAGGSLAGMSNGGNCCLPPPTGNGRTTCSIGSF